MPRITVNDAIIDKNAKLVQAEQAGATLKVKYYSNNNAKLHFIDKFGEKHIIREKFNRNKFQRELLKFKYQQRQKSLETL